MQAIPRRVVTGIKDGKSTIIEDSIFVMLRFHPIAIWDLPFNRENRIR